LSSAGTFMLNSLTNGIVVGIPQLLAQGSEMLHQYQSVIQTNFPVIMQNGVSIITNLLTGILSAAPQIIAQVGEMMTTWVGDAPNDFRFRITDDAESFAGACRKCA
jgi:phage-related protein